MIVAAAILPAAPLSIDGVSATVPEDIEQLRAAARRVVEHLPDAEVAVLVTAAAGSAGGEIHDCVETSLAGYGRPDLAVGQQLHRPTAVALADALQFPLLRAARLPGDLAVLSLHLGGRWPVVPIAVPPTAQFEALAAVGTGIVGVLDQSGLDGLLVVAGDLSASLAPCSPRPGVAGAAAFDRRVVSAVESGELDGLDALGPDEARRVHSRGWAALAVAHGACAAARLPLALEHYSAPRGVGYLVART